jgi:uncharacterized protein
MSVNRMVAGIARVALVAGTLAVLGVSAQAQQPSADAMANAREIVDLKGAATLFNPVIPGVIERAKLVFLQTNPNLQRDLDSVAQTLRTEYAARNTEIRDQLARTYAQHFNEQELKDIVVFYKSPLGKKMNQEEPKFVDQSMTFVADWADKLLEEVSNKFRSEMKKKGHDI